MNQRQSLAKRIFGSTYPLAKHFGEITALFLAILLCIFVVRHAIPTFFPPSETLGKVLHVLDAYAALLGIVGYTIWITLDMIVVLIQRARKFGRSMKRKQP